jgi:hypothetical protein
MDGNTTVDTTAPSRTLLRQMREGSRVNEGGDTLPESHLWQLYCELRQRGEERAEDIFLRGLKNLHRRRALGGVNLSENDPNPSEHQLVDDPMLRELWRAYKRCICAARVVPASQLLRDIEDQLTH